MTQNVLGRPLWEALSSLPPEAEKPRLVETAAPKRDGGVRLEGTPRVIACRENIWIAARFLDQAPRDKEDA